MKIYKTFCYKLNDDLVLINIIKNCKFLKQLSVQHLTEVKKLVT